MHRKITEISARPQQVSPHRLIIAAVDNDGQSSTKETANMKLYTIGYGGRGPDEFLRLLQDNGIRAVVDVRLRPDRSSMGTYARAKTPDKGIEGLLSRVGIQYLSFTELGNLFLDFEDWQTRYRNLMERAGDLLTERLRQVPQPFCLMCAEKSADRCHRAIIAGYLGSEGHLVRHIG
jgi:uncharacterized protein (DUF488 family)